MERKLIIIFYPDLSLCIHIKYRLFIFLLPLTNSEVLALVVGSIVVEYH